MYATGRRVVQNDAKGRPLVPSWTKRAHVRPPASIERIYENGYGVRQDRVAALMSIVGQRTTAISGRGSKSIDFGELSDGPHRDVAKREPCRDRGRSGGLTRPLGRVG